jgi:hypothetical protein
VFIDDCGKTEQESIALGLRIGPPFRFFGFPFVTIEMVRIRGV